jgi:hypothetical protein
MTDDLLAATMTVTDRDLDDPAVRAAALAVVEDLATIPPSLAHRRHRARRAVAVAAACLFAAGAAAAYTAGSRPGTAKVDPAAVTDSTVETTIPERTPDPAEPVVVDSVCDPVLMWLAPDASLTDAQAAVSLLHAYRKLTLAARDSQEAEQAQAMLAAVDAGDRRAVEDFASQNCPD